MPLASPCRRLGVVLAGAAFALSVTASLPAAADPPSWAPAHGWRKHHQHDDEDDDDDGRRVVVRPAYGIPQQTCYRDVLGAAIGGAAGGLVGSQVGHGSGRTAATVGGVVIGALVGGAIGSSMDRIDQACIGQVLEHAPDQAPIAWCGDRSEYRVVPTRSWETAGRYCREYQTQAVIGGRWQTVYGTACREADGDWQIVN